MSDDGHCSLRVYESENVLKFNIEIWACDGISQAEDCCVVS